MVLTEEDYEPRRLAGLAKQRRQMEQRRLDRFHRARAERRRERVGFLATLAVVILVGAFLVFLAVRFGIVFEGCTASDPRCTP